MARLLPCVLGRPKDLLYAPFAGQTLPARNPGFTTGDPREWIPGTLARLEEGGAPALPWTADSDLLLAPFPRPGEEWIELVRLLGTLADRYPVALYEREVALLPNVVQPGPPGEEEGEAATPAAGLRAWRAALRDRGRGGAEALAVLPARRMQLLLRGSFLGELRPGPGGSLQSRRYLALALDHARTLLVLAGASQGGRTLAPAERIAVVMPHFDDESLQCGGAIAAARAAGCEVRLIWLTDGAAGLPEAGAEESARIRHEEARAAAAALGVEDFHFLDAPETRLRRRGPWTARLRRLLEEFSPTRVHTTWWADNHLDHYEASRVLRAAWPRGRSWEAVQIAASGLWTPLSGGSLLPLEERLLERKRAAVAAHASQVRAVDYARAGRGLDLWYGRDLPGAVPAECFLCLPAADWWRAFRRSGASRRLFLGGR